MAVAVAGRVPSAWMACTSREEVCGRLDRPAAAGGLLDDDLGDVELIVLEGGKARRLDRGVAAAGVEDLPGRTVEDHVRRGVGALERHHRARKPGREVDGIGRGLCGAGLDLGALLL